MDVMIKELKIGESREEIGLMCVKGRVNFKVNVEKIKVIMV